MKRIVVSSLVVMLFAFLFAKIFALGLDSSHKRRHDSVIGSFETESTHGSQKEAQAP